MTRAAASGHHAWVEARRDSDFASFLPYLRENVELKRRYAECFEWDDSPYTPLLDDYEPGMTTSRGDRGLRGPAPGAHRPRRGRARGRRIVPPRRLPRRQAAGVRGEHRLDTRLRGRILAHRSDGASVLHVVLEPRRPPDDAVLPRQPRVGVVEPARGRARAVRARDRLEPDADAPRERPLAGDERVSEPHLGEPRRPLTAVLDALVPRAPGDVPGRCSGRSSSTASCVRSTAPSPD